jgi:hypothetical protein
VSKKAAPKTAVNVSILALSFCFISLVSIRSHALTASEQARETQKIASPFGPLETSLKQNFLFNSLPTYSELTQNVYSLLDYMRSHLDPESRASLLTHIDPYNRLKHFGTWINPDPSSGCMDTRARVLARDAEQNVPIEYGANNCTIVKGGWLDPYTGTEFKVATTVQIDHVVPLKHIYLSGAYAWEPRRRCQYANFLATNYQLLAVSGHENMSKGDHAPDLYMPPSVAFQCRYLNIWMRVKMEWQLTVAPEELAAIEKLEQTLQCPSTETEIGSEELTQVQTATNNYVQACLNFEQGVATAPTSPAVVVQ